MWQPGYEGTLGKNGYGYMYSLIPLLRIWNYHNIFNQLYFNIIKSYKNIYILTLTTRVTIVTAELQWSLFANFKSHVVNRGKQAVQTRKVNHLISHWPETPSQMGQRDKKWVVLKHLYLCQDEEALDPTPWCNHRAKECSALASLGPELTIKTPAWDTCLRLTGLNHKWERVDL